MYFIAQPLLSWRHRFFLDITVDAYQFAINFFCVESLYDLPFCRLSVGLLMFHMIMNFVSVQAIHTVHHIQGEAVVIQCPKRWAQLDDMCYYFSKNTSSWLDALV